MSKKKRSIFTKEHWSDTYTGSGVLLVRLFFVFAIALLISAHPVQPSYAKDKENESVDLYLDISFDSNLLMNKYDVSLELDGEQIDVIEYDKYYTNLCEVKPGKHIISVYKDDEREVLGEQNIQVEEDSTFQCQLKTKRKEIEFEEPTILKGTAGHSIEMPDCVGLHLVDALNVLEQKGFVNYHYVSDKEEKIKENNWAVDIQNVKVGEIIDKNDEIVLTCVPAEEYITKTFTGLAYSDALKKAKAIGYKNIEKIDSRIDGDEPTRLSKKSISDETKQFWMVESAEDNFTDDATLTLNFAYNVTMPDLSGKRADKADKQMESINLGHFSCYYVGYKSGNDISSEDLKKYKIVEQSEEPGSIIKYQSQITFKCKKTKEAKEAEKKARLAAKAKAEKEAREDLERRLNAEVWYTNTGKCYHTKSCDHLLSEKGHTTQRAAIKMDLKPCSDCIRKGQYYIEGWEKYK